MIITDHAKGRLSERYSKWGLNIKFAERFFLDLNIENPGNYEIVNIDNIPVVVVCDGDIIPTIYPHPIDMAIQTREYKQEICRLLKINSKLYGNLQQKEKNIGKQKTKIKLLKQKLKRGWE
jgi:hypothetical protein